MSKIREILEEKKISQAELVRRTGISKNQISNFILAKNDITLKRAKKIADALEVKIDDLI